jgi:hypothetical protein
MIVSGKVKVDFEVPDPSVADPVANETSPVEVEVVGTQVMIVVANPAESVVTIDDGVEVTTV